MRCKNRASLTPVTLTAAGPLRRCPSIGTAAATFTPVIQTAAGSVSRRPDASQPRLSQLALAAVAVPRGRRAVTVTAHDSFRTRPGPQRRRGHPDSESGRGPTRNWKPPVGRLHSARTPEPGPGSDGSVSDGPALIRPDSGSGDLPCDSESGLERVASGSGLSRACWGASRRALWNKEICSNFTRT